MKMFNLFTAAGLLLALAYAVTGCGKAVPAAAPAPTATPLPTVAPTVMPTPTPTPMSATVESAAPTVAPAQLYAGVPLAEYVTPEMLQPEAWLRPGDDAIFMSQAQVQAFNAAVVETLAPDERMFDLDALSAQGTLPGSQVAAWMEADPQLDGTEQINGRPMEAGYLDALMGNKAQASIPETVPLRYGVATMRCNVRLQPTMDFAGGAGEVFIDGLQQAEVYCNEPMLVLHESADGLWYYIVSSRMTGWLPQDAVALFATREDWQSWQQPADFLVVTADCLTLDVNTAQDALSRLELTMGTALPLAAAEETPTKVAGRIPYGNYIVKMPVRGGDGLMQTGYVPIPVSSDVSRGYLPCTRANVLRQIFKLQGHNYGWGGTQHSSDCSGIAVEVYRCFGLELARNSKSLSMMPGKTLVLEGLDSAQRTQALAELPVGSVLYMPGHIMLYLGQRDGRCYVMSATGIFTPVNSGEAQRVFTILINTLDVRRNNHDSWLNQLHCAKVIGPLA